MQKKTGLTVMFPYWSVSEMIFKLLAQINNLSDEYEISEINPIMIRIPFDSEVKQRKGRDTEDSWPTKFDGRDVDVGDNYTHGEQEKKRGKMQLTARSVSGPGFVASIIAVSSGYANKQVSEMNRR